MDLTKGTDPNMLKLLVDNIEIKPHSIIRAGMIEASIMIQLNRYNLDDLLCQLMDEYGEAKIIDRITALK